MKLWEEVLIIIMSNINTLHVVGLKCYLIKLKNNYFLIKLINVASKKSQNLKKLKLQQVQKIVSSSLRN